jgi:hypothetical protein
MVSACGVLNGTECFLASIIPYLTHNGLTICATQHLADNKYYQKIIACSCGLLIPETITSNDKQELMAFASLHKEVALKFMSQELYTAESGSVLGLYVNKIVAQQFSDFAELGENPVTLQPYINKLYEVRYTFIDGDHLVCKIESQRSARASIDWRRYDCKTRHIAQLLPQIIYPTRFQNL